MNGEFSPQPYTQLAKVLRSMGMIAMRGWFCLRRKSTSHRQKSSAVSSAP